MERKKIEIEKMIDPNCGCEICSILPHVSDVIEDMEWHEQQAFLAAMAGRLVAIMGEGDVQQLAEIAIPAFLSALGQETGGTLTFEDGMERVH